MRKAIPVAVKQLVIARANAVCEYCKYPEEDSFFVFHIEHIRSIKHGGTDDESNLAYSCPPCNHAKGSDVGTFVGKEEVLVRLFHPRKDVWEDHFLWDGTRIVGTTLVGKATVQLLKFNDVDRLVERQRIIQLK
ncbi:MAG: HNH endonuclease [Bacteroidota bacterium]